MTGSKSAPRSSAGTTVTRSSRQRRCWSVCRRRPDYAGATASRGCGQGVRAAVRSTPRTRETANDKAAPKSAWGVQRGATARVSRQMAVGPRAAADTPPPPSFAGVRRAGRAKALPALPATHAPRITGSIDASVRSPDRQITRSRDNPARRYLPAAARPILMTASVSRPCASSAPKPSFTRLVSVRISWLPFSAAARSPFSAPVRLPMPQASTL